MFCCCPYPCRHAGSPQEGSLVDLPRRSNLPHKKDGQSNSVKASREDRVALEMPGRKEAVMEGFKPGTPVSVIGRRDFVKLGTGAAAAKMAMNTRGSFAQIATGKPVSVDVHTHWAPEPYSQALDQVR